MVWLATLCLQDVLEYIEGMREYDVPYHVRFAIDTGTHRLGTAANMPPRFDTASRCQTHLESH
jgi:hypothetical protein